MCLAKPSTHFMEQTTQSTPQPTPQQKNVGMAVLAYIIFFIPLLTDAKNDPFVKYHVKQGLVLFILAVIAMAIERVLPYTLSSMLYSLFSLAIIVLAVMGIMNAVNGKETPLPFIGQYADKFNF